MRKDLLVFFILLFTLATVVSSFSAICYADEIQDNSCYYEAMQDITLYKNQSEDYPMLTIPKTYYFKIVGGDENYVIVRYNNVDFYAKRSTIENTNVAIKREDLTSLTTPYYQTTITLPNQKISLYYEDFTTSIEAVPHDAKFIGYYVHNNVAYFCVSVQFKKDDNANLYFVEANVVNPDFSVDSILPHPNSSESRIREANEKARIAQNELKRNIFFFVICFLCAVVVILIYNPFKKKTSLKNNTSYSSEDDY